jgi:hypothetical protein
MTISNPTFTAVKVLSEREEKSFSAAPLTRWGAPSKAEIQVVLFNEQWLQLENHHNKLCDGHDIQLDCSDSHQFAKELLDQGQRVQFIRQPGQL